MAKQNENGQLQVILFVEGYQTKELVAALDMAVIRNKNKDVLSELETVLGVRYPR